MNKLIDNIGNSIIENPQFKKHKSIFLIFIFALLTIVSGFIILYFIKTLLINTKNNYNDNQASNSSFVNKDEITKEYTLSQYVYPDYIPSVKLIVNVSKAATISTTENNTGIKITDDNFELIIATVTESAGGVFYSKPEVTVIKNDLYRIKLNGEFLQQYPNTYYYDSTYKENTNGQCSQFQPTPLACGSRMVGQFSIYCTPTTDLGLAQCDKIVETLKYENIK